MARREWRRNRGELSLEPRARRSCPGCANWRPEKSGGQLEVQAHDPAQPITPEKQASCFVSCRAAPVTLLTISWDRFLLKAGVGLRLGWRRLSWHGGQVKPVGRRGVKQNLGFNESGTARSAKMSKCEEAKSPETGF